MKWNSRIAKWKLCVHSAYRFSLEAYNPLRSLDGHTWRQFNRRSSLICRPAILRRTHMGDISLFCGTPLRRQAYMESICLSADHESPQQHCPFELHSPHLQAEVGAFSADPSVDRIVLPLRTASSPVIRSDWRCQTCDVRAKTCGVLDRNLDEISCNNSPANA
jgi:hypothetical protein